MDNYNALLARLGVPSPGASAPGQGHRMHPNRGLHLGWRNNPDRHPGFVYGQPPGQLPGGPPASRLPPPASGGPQGAEQLYGMRHGGTEVAAQLPSAVMQQRPPMQPQGNAYGLQAVRPGNAPGHSGAPGQIGRPEVGPGRFNQQQSNAIARVLAYIHGNGNRGR